jgi:hypothetical protein
MRLERRERRDLIQANPVVSRRLRVPVTARPPSLVAEVVAQTAENRWFGQWWEELTSIGLK